MRKCIAVLCLLLFCVCTLPFLQAQQPDKAIVIEDHTGAWCGWCVVGSQALEDLHAEYGNRIIPIAWHNDDAMALPMQQTMAKKFKITGYPTGLLNRDEYSVNGVTATGVHPDNWASIVKEALKLKADIGVRVEWSINEQTQILSGTVRAEAFKDIDQQLAFNVAIMEDSLTGSGKDWEQVNYLTNRKGYESHPYFYKPARIENYYHINVLREFIGGENGDTGSFGATVEKGAVNTYTFQIDLKNYSIQNAKNIWVAAMVIEHGNNNRILNAASSGKKPTPKSTYWKAEISLDKDYVSATRQGKVEYTVTIENKNDKDITALVSLDPTESRLPEGWSATFSQPEIAIAAKQKATVKLTVELGNTPGFAALVIQSLVKPFENYRSLPVLQKAGVLSDGVKWAIARFDLGSYAEMTHFLNSYDKIEPYNKDYAIIPINARTLEAYNFKQFSLFILPESYISRTSLIFDNALATTVRSMSISGIPILITSPMDLWLTAGNYGNVVPSSIRSIMNDDFGISGEKRSWGPWLWNAAEGKSVTVGVRSIANNGVTQTLDFNLNETDAVHTVQTHWLDEIKIVDETRVHKILEYYGDKIGDKSTTAAVWIQMPRSTAIYQGFGFEAMKDEPVRRTLLANYLGFLQRTVSVPPDDINRAAIRVSPNPAQRVIQIQFNTEHPNAKAELVDTQGRTLQQLAFSPGCGEVTLHTDVSLLASATYFVLVNDGGLHSVYPIVIEH